MKKLIAFGILALGAAGAVGTGIVQGQNNVITIGGYDGATDTATVNELITKYVKPKLAADGVEVKYVPTAEFGKTILNQLSAGTAPDLFYLEDAAAQGLISTNRVLALNGLVDTKPFLPTLNRAFTVGGKTYGIAKDFNTLTLYYNKDLFDQAKVAYPDDNDTWADFETKTTNVQKALGKGYYGTCFPAEYARFGAFAASTGWKPIVSGRTILDNRFKSAFTFYTNLVKKGVAAKPGQVNAGWGGDCIKSGKVATAFEGGWALGFLRDNAPNLKYGTSMLPLDPATKKRGNLIYTVAWAINAGTKNKAAAVKVMQALTSVEAQQFILRSGLALPSRVSLQDDPYLKGTAPEQVAFRNVFRGASEGNAVSFAADRFGSDWYRPIDEALNAAMDGQKSVDQAVKDAQAGLDRVMKK
ncbi:MAG: extracellular solute-binding protein [Pleurocapsa sp. SU_196_0]|nr:extracellular solute-binding protein [Pleurocapsa sp. SU_196_0]